MSVLVGGPDATEAAPSEDHALQFYETDDFLADVVSRYALEGLDAGANVLLVATEAHRRLFVGRLQERGVAVEALTASGSLTLLDAEAALGSFMVGELPDWTRFESTVGAKVHALAATGRPLRAYGEMVDLLWRAGNRTGALVLEEMWNALRTQHPFSLLCAYVVDGFFKARDVHEVCRTHGRTLEPQNGCVELAGHPGEASDGGLARSHVRAAVAASTHRRTTETALRQALVELHRAEEKARRSERHLEDFIENAPVGLHWVGPDGLVLWVNRAELELLGYDDPADVVGRPVLDLHADREVGIDILARLHRGETLHGVDARLRRRDGQIRHVLISSNVYTEGGRFIHTRCFTRDITQRKDLEGDRTRLIADLREALDVNERFTAILGHDLQNPVAAITTAARMARRHQDDPARLARYVELMGASSERMSRMIRHLVDFARHRRARGIPIVRAEMDLLQVVRQVVEELEVGRGAPSIRLEHAGDLVGAWDRDRLAQVFSNLIGNALQHGDPGQPVHVRIDGLQAASIRVVVENAGAIAEPLLPCLFEPFLASVPDDRERGGGLGLGLYISREIVKAHQGGITVSSSQASGTRVLVELPRRADGAGLSAGQG
jgi:PAS domain S-box-containing protein